VKRSARIEAPREKLADFCRRHWIRKLSFFGSVLRDDFGSGMLGRKVDLNTAGCLSPHFRDEVLRDAAPAYEQA